MIQRVEFIAFFKLVNMGFYGRVQSFLIGFDRNQIVPALIRYIVQYRFCCSVCINCDNCILNFQFGLDVHDLTALVFFVPNLLRVQRYASALIHGI